VPAASSSLPDVLQAVLNVSLSATQLLRPIYSPDGKALLDFSLDYCNPAGQRLTGLPERDGGTLTTRSPQAAAAGVLDYYRRAFETGETAPYATTYQVDGLTHTFRGAAQRQGEWLVVSFSDVPSVDERAEGQGTDDASENQSSELSRLFAQAPVAMALFRGADYIIELANEPMATVWGRPLAQVLGRPVFTALPEVQHQGFEALFANVLAQGTDHDLHEMPVTIDRGHTGQPTQGYFNLTYRPQRDAQGRITGIITSAQEVTEQVLARHQVELLNQELEARVQQRTQELAVALRTTEQQRAQLQVQQGLLSQILGQVPAGIATLSGPEHRYSFFNGPYQSLVAGRAALGRAVSETLPELVEQGIVSLLDRVYRTGQPFFGTEIMLMLHNPTTGQPEQHYLDFTYQPLLDGQQRTQGILVFVLDVTDRVRSRKQAETLQAAMLAVVQRQAQERENLYQLFEQAPAAVCLLREPDHRIEYHNPAYQALFPGQVLRGRTMAEVQPEATALVARFDSIYQSGQTQSESDVPVLVAPAGSSPPSTRYFDFTYPAYREAGRITGVSVFGFDVTERVLARQQRKAQQAELQRLFEHVPVAIGILRGPSFVVELANAALGAVWGRPSAQVLGRPFFEALPDLRGQGFEQLFTTILASGEPLYLTEVPVQLDAAGTGHPTTGYFNCAYQPWSQTAGETAGMIAVAVDVTEQVLARQQVLSLNYELRGANTRLTRTNTDLDTFVYTASHDLKAPISNIEGLLLALQQELPAVVLQQPMILRLLDLMQGSVERFQQTIGHLTHISQLQEPETAETVNLAALIADVRLDLAPLLEATPANLTVSLQGCEAMRVVPKTLRSVVYNLLSNAVKYRAPGRPALVQMRAICEPGRLTLEVQDNGLGLTPAQQKQLFGMFRRLHTHVEGSGVGLFMVKRLVENAGGTITVASQPGVGSTFTVALPA
jgi:signal transduction histidine kinase